MFEKTQNTQRAPSIWRTKHIFERLSLKNKQGAQQACKKRAISTWWIRESFQLEKALRSSSWDLCSSDSSCHTYMFLWVKRLLFAASLLASDNSTILCSSDLILESIALIIWNTAESLWDGTMRAVTKIKFIKKSELLPETKELKENWSNGQNEQHRCNYWSYLQLLSAALMLGKSSHYQGTKQGVHSKLRGFFKENILEDTLNFKNTCLKICINQWISFKAARQHYRTSNKIILLEISLRKALFKQLWFPAQHHIPPSVQPGLCISHVLLLHVFWAYSQVLPYLQDPSSSDFPTPKWRHFFCLNFICFTGQRASRKKIVNTDFFFSVSNWSYLKQN